MAGEGESKGTRGHSSGSITRQGSGAGGSASVGLWCVCRRADLPQESFQGPNRVEGDGGDEGNEGRPSGTFELGQLCRTRFMQLYLVTHSQAFIVPQTQPFCVHTPGS